MTKDLSDLFAEAYQLQYQGDLPKAISLYQKIVEQNPDYLDALHFLGLTYAQSGDIKTAIHYLLKAQAIDATDPAVLNNLANAYKKTDQLDEAIRYYLKAIALKPDYAQAHNNLATIYAQRNQYQEALVHYKKAVHASPDFVAAHFNLGLLLVKNNELAAAKTQFTNVLSLNPNHLEAQFYLGVLAIEAGELEKAEEAFQAVLTLDAEHVEAITNLGVIALKRDENQIAVDLFSKALALDNDHIDARNNLAATFIHHDRFENALMHYDVLLKKDPENIEYLYNSGVAEMALGHLDKASVFFDGILKLQADHVPALNNQAAIYLKKNEKEKAQQFLERALTANPNDTASEHMLNAIKGKSEAKTSPEYAQNLFNNYALYYDQHMQGALEYGIPQHTGRMIHQLEIHDIDKTLDLGCGTGLSGPILREISQHVTGIDIAEKMLAHAKEKAIYDVLVESEVTQFLQTDKTNYDLILAADVLPYFGDLSSLFKEVANHLTPQGFFIFSTEISNSTPWKLELTARFSHLAEYIAQLCEKNNLHIIEQEKIPARKQNEAPLEVILYAVRKAQ